MIPWHVLIFWPSHSQAYRPCPTCAEKGMRYVRQGQTLYVALPAPVQPRPSSRDLVPCAEPCDPHRDEVVFKKNPAGGYYGEDDD